MKEISKDAVVVAEMQMSPIHPELRFFEVKLNMMQLNQSMPDALVRAIVDGVSDFISKGGIGEEISKGLLEKCEKEITEQVVKRVSDELFQKVLSKIDVTGLANIASLYAGKKIGGEL